MNMLPSCDTLVVLGNCTKSGNLIFAKNSDRPVTESQPLVTYPSASYSKGEKLKCTYIDIDQAEKTYRVIGSKPWWLWGFEHGINEHGVVIGNEAAWSCIPVEEDDGLIGMDLLRLGLERGRTAYEAMHIIISLLGEYGQGGACAYGPEGSDFRYHNLFIIADHHEAWVLETVQRHWVAKKVKDFACISNLYSIGTDYDECSEGIVEFAISKGLHIEGTPFDFAKSFTSIKAGFMSGYGRMNRMRKLLNLGVGHLDVPYITNILRDHFEGDIIEYSWSPVEAFNPTICMHGIDPNPSHTAASAVIEMKNPERTLLSFTYWGSMCTPCISFFIPFYNIGIIPESLSIGKDKYNSDSIWWNLFRMCLAVESNYEKYANKVQSIRNEMEDEFRKKSMEIEQTARCLLDVGMEQEAHDLLKEFTNKCLERVISEVSQLICDIEKDLHDHPGQIYRATYINKVRRQTDCTIHPI